MGLLGLALLGGCSRSIPDHAELVPGIVASRAGWLEQYPGAVIGIVGSGVGAVLIDRFDGDLDDIHYEMVLISGEEYMRFGVYYGDTIAAGCAPVGFYGPKAVVRRPEMETHDYYLDGEIVWRMLLRRWKFSHEVPHGLRIVPVSLGGGMALYLPWMVSEDEGGPPQRLLVVAGKATALEAGEVLILADGEARVEKLPQAPLLVIEMGGVWAYVYDEAVEFRDPEGRLLRRYEEVLGVRPADMGTDGQRLFFAGGLGSLLPPVVIGPKDPLPSTMPLEKFQSWEEACAAVNLANGNVPYRLPVPSTSREVI